MPADLRIHNMPDETPTRRNAPPCSIRRRKRITERRRRSLQRAFKSEQSDTSYLFFRGYRYVFFASRGIFFY